VAENIAENLKGSVLMIMADSALIESLIDGWWANPGEDLTAATRNRYRAALRRLCRWFAAAERRPLTVADLHPISLAGYREHLKQTEAVSTVNTHPSAIRTWCSWLVVQGYLDTNPALRLKLVKRTASSAPKALSPAQVNALLRQAQATRNPIRNTAMLQMLIQTGIRISECAALGWHDIHYGERSGQMLVRSGKGNKVRTVPLNESARTALAAYVAPLLGVESTIRAVAGAWPLRRDGEPLRPLWISERQTALSVREISHMIQQMVRDAAVRDLVPASTTPHSLRHTFATRYLARHPHDLVGLARLLGHSSITTTQIYVQPTEVEITARVEQLDLNAYGETI
jgi:site-specific recombinase XerD